MKRQAILISALALLILVGRTIFGQAGFQPGAVPIQGITCTPAGVCSVTGGGSGPTIQTNGTNNSSQSTLNFQNPSNFNGLTFTFSNPSGGTETFAVGGTLNNSGLTTPGLTASAPYLTDGTHFYMDYPSVHQITKPVTANFGWVTTQGTATETDTTGGGIFLLDATQATVNLRMYGESLSPSYTVVMDMYYGLSNTNFTRVGMAISDGTKLEFLGMNQGTLSPGWLLETWTNSTTQTAVLKKAQTSQGSPGWMSTKIADNGTNRVWSISFNGGVYQQVLSEASNTFLTPTKIGIAVMNDTNSGDPIQVWAWLLNCTGC